MWEERSHFLKLSINPRQLLMVSIKCKHLFKCLFVDGWLCQTMMVHNLNEWEQCDIMINSFFSWIVMPAWIEYTRECCEFQLVKLGFYQSSACHLYTDTAKIKEIATHFLFSMDKHKIQEIMRKLICWVQASK